MIYNDAYSVFAGGRHPGLLGSKVREGWPEVADFNDNVMKVGPGGRHPLLRGPGAGAVPRTAARAGLDEPRLLAGHGREAARRRGDRRRRRDHRARCERKRAARRARRGCAFLDALGGETASRWRRRRDPGRPPRAWSASTWASRSAPTPTWTRTRTASPSAATGRRRARPASSATTAWRTSASWRCKNLGAGLPLVVNDNLRELAPEEAATFQSIGIAATICMPLVKEGRLTALMAIHDKAPRVWTARRAGADPRGDRAVLGARRARRRRGRAAGQRGELPHPGAGHAQPRLDRPADGQLDWFNDQVYAYSGAEPGAWTATAGPASSTPTTCRRRRALGRRAGDAARPTRPSSACAAPTAPIAGTSPAPCRSRTSAARSCAGSAPTPTSRTRRRSPQALADLNATLREQAFQRRSPRRRPSALQVRGAGRDLLQDEPGRPGMIGPRA